MSLPKVAMISNIPSPYREETHVLLNKKLGDGYHVFYCAHTEANRLWKVKFGNYNKTFLKKSTFTISNKPVYFNRDILKSLNKFNPDVVITAGFFPTMLLAFLWCKWHRKSHIVYTDGTINSEHHLTVFHKLVRRIVYRFTDAFVGVSEKTMDMYKSYNVKKDALFLSPYCANNELLKTFWGTTKKYDVIFCGQLIERKMPFFFINTIKLVNNTMPCKVLIVGSGELQGAVLESLNQNNIDYSFPGFVQTEEFPEFFASAKICAFPSKYDAWGLVANESCAFGIPVITCKNAGVADELIKDGYNGYVLPLNEKTWADHIIKLLTDNDLYTQLSRNAVESVQKYTYDTAVEGIMNAVNFTQLKTKSRLQNLYFLRKSP